MIVAMPSASKEKIKIVYENMQDYLVTTEIYCHDKLQQYNQF